MADGEENHKNCYSTGLTDKRTNGIVRDERQRSDEGEDHDSVAL